MYNEAYLEKETEYLFGCNYLSDEFDPDGTEHEDEHYNRAQALINRYSWNVVFEAWSNYLHKMCRTEEDVINFCNLFFLYGGSEQPIPEPYRFCASLYYRIDVKKVWTMVMRRYSFCWTVLRR